MKTSGVSYVLGLLILLASTLAWRVSAEPTAIEVSADTNGTRLGTQFLILHDPGGQRPVQKVLGDLRSGQFSQAEQTGSTGMQPGAFWITFTLHNPSTVSQKLIVEYVDHQLISLQAYSLNDRTALVNQLADLSLDRPFSARSIDHHRFAFAVDIPAQTQQQILVKLGSKGRGYVFPNLRLWSEQHFSKLREIETGGMAFLFGGIFIIASLALIAGIATKETFFYAYAVYCFSKIAAWGTIFGLTHRHILTDNFHWSYMSISGGITIFCGLLFSRMFLQTRQFTPKLDRLIRIMQLNAIILILAGVLQIKVVAITTITIALLLYPVNFLAGIVRWRQGSKEAAVFALAWSFLMLGLVAQALRDLGFVEHNLLNYYWPAVASYTEVIVIMAAMGLKVHRMRLQKEHAEHKYTQQLEQSTQELEQQVAERTLELEKAKQIAEVEASTDSLTGTRNRRSFLADSDTLLQQAKTSDITFSLLMFDIDNFKAINDKYGHQTGDQALIAFAKLVQDKIRDGDIFGRLGGEEFSLLVCGDKANAMAMAERLRAQVSELTIDTVNGALTFTTSIGVAHLNDQSLIEELLNQADRALYRAKQAGRNRVVEG